MSHEKAITGDEDTNTISLRPLEEDSNVYQSNFDSDNMLFSPVVFPNENMPTVKERSTISNSNRRLLGSRMTGKSKLGKTRHSVSHS